MAPPPSPLERELPIPAIAPFGRVSSAMTELPSSQDARFLVCEKDLVGT